MAAASPQQNELHCCVCLDGYLYSVITVPCGHSFCGEHAIEIWRTSGSQARGQKFACPQCRELVQMTIPNYGIRNVEVRRFANDNERQKIETDLRTYNKTFAHDPNESTLSRVRSFFLS